MQRKTDAKQVAISLQCLIRSVASSSAIETGERTEIIEKRLIAAKRRFPTLTLAK